MPCGSLVCPMAWNREWDAELQPALVSELLHAVSHSHDGEYDSDPDDGGCGRCHCIGLGSGLV